MNIYPLLKEKDFFYLSSFPLPSFSFLRVESKGSSLGLYALFRSAFEN